MLKYLKGYRVQAILAPLFKMIEAAFDLLVPVVMADIINNGVAAGSTQYILNRCLLLVLLAALGYVFSISAQYFSAKAAVGYGTSLRKSLFSHIQSLGLSESGGIGVSTLVTRMTGDTAQIQNGLNLFLRLFLRSPFVVIGSFIMAFFINKRLSLIFAAVIVVVSMIVYIVMRVTMPLYKKTQAGLDTLTRLTRENLSGVRVVRAFNRERGEVDEFRSESGALTGLQLFVGRISTLLNPISMLIINLSIVAIIYKGGVAVNVGELRPGDVIALVSYMSQILIELLKVVNLIIQVSRSLACASRVKATLDIKADMSFGSTAEIPTDSTPAFELQNVSMKYQGSGGESIKGVSFSAEAGQTIGIIGGTGSGKSTLVKLIPRLYDATGGSLYLFGRPIGDYTEGAVRGAVGIVTQQPLLFSGTIRSNLLWGNEKATDEQLWSALAIAQAEQFVRQKPLMLESPVEQGGKNLSGGQRQRLTIARAIVKNPRILILDDSSSALDYLTDAALRAAIHGLCHGLTVVIVSQRTASVMNADKIVVLDDGRAVGIGTHSELLDGCAVYKEIYDSQFKTGADEYGK